MYNSISQPCISITIHEGFLQYLCLYASLMAALALACFLLRKNHIIPNKVPYVASTICMHEMNNSAKKEHVMLLQVARGIAHSNLHHPMSSENCRTPRPQHNAFTERDLVHETGCKQYTSVASLHYD